MQAANSFEKTSRHFLRKLKLFISETVSMSLAKASCKILDLIFSRTTSSLC